MKIIILLVSVLAVAVAVPADTYNSKYDDFNAQELRENETLLKHYGKCFIDAGPCTPEGNDIKKIIPEALQTECAKCSPKQRQLIREVIQAFQEKLPEIWEGIVKKHDPKGEYKEKFNQFISSSN